MAFDAAQLLRQTFAARNEALQMMDLAQTRTEAVSRPVAGELMGTAVVVEADPMAELMDSMEELSFQFEEKEMKRTSERKMGEMQGPRTAYMRAVESWMAMMPDMPGQDFMAKMLRNLRAAQAMGQMPDPQELMKELARGSTDPSHQYAMLDVWSMRSRRGNRRCRIWSVKPRRSTCRRMDRKSAPASTSRRRSTPVPPRRRRCRPFGICIAAR